jgi:hypothetical protein
MPNEFKIGTNSEAEEADVVVCLPVTDPLKFRDNLVGRCSKCSKPIQYRPNAPKNPPKICWNCAVPDMNKNFEDGDLQVIVGKEAAREVADFLAKKMRH